MKCHILTSPGVTHSTHCMMNAVGTEWTTPGVPRMDMSGLIWASSRENLSLGFSTKRDSNQSPQLQGLARKVKVHLWQV